MPRWSRESKRFVILCPFPIYGFSKERGYGFISPLGEGEEVFVEDFFVRNWGVGGARSTTLEEGEPVLYQVTRDEWGATAENVCILRSSRPAVR